MSSRQIRSLWTTLVVSTLILAGCGGGGSGSSSGTTPPPPPPPAGNNVVASWSLNGTVRAIVGGNQTVNVAFITDDGKAVTNFTVTQNLAALPAGWSSNTTSLSCSSVTTGNGCVLLLKYAPTAVASGQLSIAYSYTDSQSVARTGTATIAYGATSHNNVVATVEPVGQVNTAVGGSRTVTVLFTTDDGAAATNLQVTSGLSALPAGWSGASTFACPVVANGNGCLLTLTYSPTAAASGTLTLNYSFADNTATASTGALSIPYAATTDNHVIAAVSPAGQVAALVGAPGRNVSVSFTTDDGNAATNLQITGSGLSTLATAFPGWTGPATFTCPSVSTGNGCQLNLSYAPTAAGAGTLLFNYSYVNGAGATQTGVVSIPFSATSDNNVIATVAPSGQINALAGGGELDVAITFTTDDANQASNLNIASGLSGLPAGWTGPATFTCAGFATSNGCQLVLHYAPTAVASGTVILNYTYASNSGVAKTGSVNLPYQATSHNNLVYTSSPSGQITAVLTQGTQVVNIVFTSDDGNPVTGVSITSGLSTLPTDWTGPSTFTCATASTGNTCSLALTFQPLVKSSGTINLAYAYTDNSGAAQTGTVNVPYASIPTYFYANEQQTKVLRCAASFDDGSLSGCGIVATGFQVPYGLTFTSSHVYIADRGDTVNSVAGDLFVCPVNADGTFGNCIPAATTGTFTAPNASAVSGNFLYVADSNGGVIKYCAIDPVSGALSNCATTAQSAAVALDVPDGIAIVNGYAYIVDYRPNAANGNLTICSIDSITGALVACTQQPIGPNPGGVTAYNGNLYIGTTDDVISRCAINPLDGSVPACVATDVTGSSSFSGVVGFGFVNGFAYVSGFGGASGTQGGIAYCPLDVSGGFASCTRSTDKSTKNVNFFGLAAH